MSGESAKKFHLEFIAPRSNLRARSWFPADELEDLTENSSLNIEGMFLHEVSLRTE